MLNGYPYIPAGSVCNALLVVHSIIVGVVLVALAAGAIRKRRAARR